MFYLRGKAITNETVTLRFADFKNNTPIYLVKFEPGNRFLAFFWGARVKITQIKQVGVIRKKKNQLYSPSPVEFDYTDEKFNELIYQEYNSKKAIYTDNNLKKFIFQSSLSGYLLLDDKKLQISLYASEENPCTPIELNISDDKWDTLESLVKDLGISNKIKQPWRIPIIV